MKTISLFPPALFFSALLVAAFAVGVMEIQFLESALAQAEEIPKEIPGVMPGGASAACGEDEFRACMEGKTSEVNACGRGCPQGVKPCLPGDPPGATCYGYDVGCLNACSSAAEQTCRIKTTCPPDVPKSSSPPPQTMIGLPSSQEIMEDAPLRIKGTLSPDQTVHTVDDSEFIEETESLADTKPQKIGPFKEEWERLRALRPPPKGNDWPVYVLAIDGDGKGVEVQTEGRKDWIGVSGGDIIPETGGYIQTDFDTEVTLVMPDGSIVTIGELSQVQLDLRPRPLGANLELKLGDMNLDVNPGTFSADTQIRAGNIVTGVRGTHFGAAYDPEADFAVFEIYDGTIRVTSEKTGKTVALSSSYDKPIKRVEIGKDGEFVYKTAIPGDEWQKRQEQAGGESEEKKTPLAFWAFAVVGFALAAGVGLVLYRRKSLERRVSQ
ncbi:MAG: hypothetical protein A2939_01640 [Parcubacteria group bacterium RIFCSPLOWO2_01_FULL_48_18]|nr:MAG: hypothetical protein A2939_01640 [Parcubacteria group bacterium RIFCSPLOWO2_01_FULL_48_18]